MKKIVSVIGVMVALVLSLTGCVKMDVDLAVSSPEKATLNMVVAVDKNALGGRTFERGPGTDGRVRGSALPRVSRRESPAHPMTRTVSRASPSPQPTSR